MEVNEIPDFTMQMSTTGRNQLVPTGLHCQCNKAFPAYVINMSAQLNKYEI